MSYFKVGNSAVTAPASAREPDHVIDDDTLQCAGFLVDATHAEAVLVARDEIMVDGVRARFVRWAHQLATIHIVIHTDRPEPRLERLGTAITTRRHANDSKAGATYCIEFSARRNLRMMSATVPSFHELMRCTWGTHVTVRGQVARFNQAGLIDGEEMIAVLTSGENTVLASRCRRQEIADEGEILYYLEYREAGLRIGTPRDAPLTREQAIDTLRLDDVIVLNKIPMKFMSMQVRDGRTYVIGTRIATPSGPNSARLRVEWCASTHLVLVSTQLPTFDELSKLSCGRRLTIGPNAVGATFVSTMVSDGAKQFVMVKAPPNLRLPDCTESVGADRTEWLYCVRFERSGIRLHDECEGEKYLQAA